MGLNFKRKTGAMDSAVAIDALVPQSAGAVPFTSRISLVRWFHLRGGWSALDFPRLSSGLQKFCSPGLNELHCRLRMALKHLERLFGAVEPAAIELLC
ncbi:hypothetical protein D9M69_637490 [compost metagenome]